MKIQVDGIEYGSFVSANAALRLDALSNTFGFEATSDEARPLPFLGGEACVVTVDGEKILTGFIELVNVDGAGGANGEHTISIQGRDKTGDFLDSSIANLSDFRGTISLKTVIERVIAHLNPTLSSELRLQVVDQVNPTKFNAAEDIQAPEPGDNSFDFVEALARKRQVLLTSNAEGNMVIEAGAGSVAKGAFLQHQVGNKDSNNVLSYSFSADTTGRFNRYLSVSQLNPTSLFQAGTTSSSSIVSQGLGKPSTDQQIRLGRQMVLVAESMSSDSEDGRRAKWERDIRRARGRVYSAVVEGYRDPAGNIWRINTLVPILDEYAGIEATMLVNSVTFTLGEDGGRLSALSFVERNAYAIGLDEPDEEKIASGLFG